MKGVKSHGGMIIGKENEPNILRKSGKVTDIFTKQSN